MKLHIFIFTLCVLFGWVKSEYQPCSLREYPDGFVCVCNESYCDTMNVERPQNFGDFVIVSSSKSGKRFNVSRGSFKSNRNKNVHKKKCTSWLFSIRMTINREKVYQTIVGFGGAFTGSVSYLLDLMPEILRHSLYRNYYSKDEGIGYSMMRIPIGGCDFDLEPWAYNEYPVDDVKLSNFTKLDERDLKRIKQINDLKNVSRMDEIKIIGAAWSPPKWMKTNNEWSGLSSLKPEYYQTWADYHLRYLRLMAEQNVRLWGLSTGNEPLDGIIGGIFIKLMSLGWMPENQGKWIGDNLGPTLNSSEFSNLLLFSGDDQRYTFPWWFERLNQLNPKAMDYVSGLAVHWYWDRTIPPNVLDQTLNKYPGKILLNTESCVNGPVLGSWQSAEIYAIGIIQDLQHHVAGWIDWNLMLNEQGGPNYINNTVDAAIILNSTTAHEFYKQPIFYVLAHFSKFIPPGSQRIDISLNGFRACQIKIVGFLCPDNTVTIILYNNSDDQHSIDFTDDLRGTYKIELEPRSITTFIYA